MTARVPDYRLVPPGIDDARSRAVLRLFARAASEFDFSRLLMRNSAEMPADVLPLAVHERALSKYFPPEGLPEPVVRNLVDNAFALHEMTGTDAGIRAALDILGFDGEIVHWHEQVPRGYHDTQTVTAFAKDDLFGAGDPLSVGAVAAAEHAVDATKRWSQDTAFGLGVVEKGRLALVAWAALSWEAEIYPFDGAPVPAEPPLVPVAVAAAGWRVEVFAKG